MVRSNVKVMIAQKEQREGRKPPYRVLTEEIGVSSGVLTRVMNSDFDRVERKTLNTLCHFLNCGVGDLLEYVPDAEAPK